ncbi:MAG: S-methyl-5-thioribose-1-phosphate isomerase [Clostridiales bacterium]|nr:S-methyl-5-thioribose-1-phosphate isomerase [Clostridiales bacterium]
MNILELDTVSFDTETNELIIIDQTLLPGELQMMRLSDASAIREAIKRLCVRGAPAIGVAAALGLYACACRIQQNFEAEFLRCAELIETARPTAVNLSWAVKRMRTAFQKSSASEALRLEALRQEAFSIRDEDIDVCRRIGENGLALISNGDGILTHCNAGQLATVRYGTALAPIHVGVRRGMNFRVYTDETRPLLQGARLSAFEMVSAGVETTVLCDNMAASLMKTGAIQAVFVGCDRVARNGDTANKIGTLGVAIMAKHFGIPFYVCAPTSTIDLDCPNGESIEIENRADEEVTEMWYKERMAPEGVKVYNPAFDVTDADLITAFVTENGIVYPPYAF